jgi:small GTP-binding protein
MATENYYHYEFRLIFMGRIGVGKSCILGRIKDPDRFHTDYMTTVGIDFNIKTIQVEGKIIKIKLWDTAGQERFRTIIKAYYRNVVGGFLVFDVRDRKSFDELSEWVVDAKEGTYPREPTLVLVGNKIDEDVTGNHPRVVSQHEAKEFAQRFGMDYIETSAKTGQNIDELLPFLASRVYWKLRVRDIVLEDGWQGVTEGDLCRTQKPQLTSSLHLQPAASPKSNGSCCN